MKAMRGDASNWKATLGDKFSRSWHSEMLLFLRSEMFFGDLFGCLALEFVGLI